jgi:hypothetical protein
MRMLAEFGIEWFHAARRAPLQNIVAGYNYGGHVNGTDDPSGETRAMAIAVRCPLPWQ